MAEGEARGFLWGASLDGRWRLSAHSHLRLGAGFAAMHATGSQRQWYYFADGSTALVAESVPLLVEGREWSLWAGVEVEL